MYYVIHGSRSVFLVVWSRTGNIPAVHRKDVCNIQPIAYSVYRTCTIFICGKYYRTLTMYIVMYTSCTDIMYISCAIPPTWYRYPSYTYRVCTHINTRKRIRVLKSIVYMYTRGVCTKCCVKICCTVLYLLLVSHNVCYTLKQQARIT